MNAREEFVRHTDGLAVKCAEICQGHDWSDNKIYYRLPVGYTPEQYEAFLTSLNFEYDAGYGGQELFGIIWYTDGTWSNRGEYDGSEWWEHQQCPDIPDALNNQTKEIHMQVVAYKALDGKLFEDSLQQQDYDRKYLRDELMKRLALTLLDAAPYVDDLRYQAITDEGAALQALERLFMSMPEEVIKAVKALSGK